MFTEEEKIKPIECKKLTAGSGPFSSERVASDVVHGIKRYSRNCNLSVITSRWSFFISHGFDGEVLSIMTAGFSPISSYWQLFLEIVTFPFLRLASVFYIWNWKRIIWSESAKKQNVPSSRKTERTVAAKQHSAEHTPLLNPTENTSINSVQHVATL